MHFWMCSWTCLMALAPTESMKQTSVQSRMIEWTGPKPFADSDASASSTWLFPFSSNMWLGDRVLDVSLCSVNWPKSTAHWSKQFHPHICSIDRVYVCVRPGSAALPGHAFSVMKCCVFSRFFCWSVTVRGLPPSGNKWGSSNVTSTGSYPFWHLYYSKPVTFISTDI